VYEEMLSRSTKQVRPDVPGGSTITDEDLIQVYEGHLTRLFSDLGIANPYYTKIRDALVAQGCIEQLRRGGGSALSKWIVCKEPDEETFRSIMDMKRAPKGKTNMLEQQVKDLRAVCSQLLEAVEKIDDHAGELADRITVLEGKMEAMRQ
jgi:hypothetical protein